MEIKLDSVYCQIGVISLEGVYQDLSEPPEPHLKEFGLVLAWQSDWNFLELEAAPAENMQPSRAQAFRKGADSVVALAQALKRDATDLLQDLEGRVILAGKLQARQPLHLRIAIDTNDPSFMALSMNAQGTATVSLNVTVAVMSPKTDRQRRISVVFGNSKQAPNFGGFVAIDLGNTNSTLAALNSNTSLRERADAVKFVPDKPQEFISTEALSPLYPPIESVIRVKEALNVKSFTGDTSEAIADNQTKAFCAPNAFKWEIGKVAWGLKGSDGLIVGPKRRVTQPPGVKLLVTAVDLLWLQQRKAARSVTVPVDSWVPAELFVCRLIQNFQSITRTRPQQLAVTYPTSYSKRELEQLRTTLVRALKRARWEPQRREDLTKSKIDQALALTIDEASAAAYFFLFRHVFSAAGGVSRFRYLYPHGLNLLLYDCGGGTTDISLVQARAPAIDRLDINVMGRAGMREFGGDEITTIIFKLLKAKLAWNLNGAEGNAHHHEPGWKVGPPKGADANGDKWNEYLKRHDDMINLFVPTRFQPGSSNLIDQRRQQNAFALWEWAEKVKIRLAEGTDSVSQEAPTDVLPTNLAMRHDDSGQLSALRELLERIVVERAEVDGLIESQVNRSIELCNNLIRAKLTTNPQSENNQVDLVCLAGNGTRYRLIRERLREGLEVPFLKEDDDRFVYEPQQLKQVVAKGAVLALANLSGVEVTFTGRLSEQLPFDVGYSDARFNAPVPLYKEGTLYSELRPIMLQPPGTSEKIENQTAVSRHDVHLERRWPGEKKSNWGPFLTFHFNRKIEGPVEVSYDEGRNDFVVQHDGELGQLRTNENENEKFFAPVQRGKL